MIEISKLVYYIFTLENYEFCRSDLYLLNKYTF